ncbi:hypothetical protein EsDP_00005441 [Epichloe bromicola]|uniref:Uncharacterized protein n=1 Tax=Epichloe bromicola TaxID=79588 RepID=A0ABQ0CUM5_9HYPO
MNDATAQSGNTEPWSFASENQRQDVTAWCDPRLSKLSIRHWTDIDISDDLAARCDVFRFDLRGAELLWTAERDQGRDSTLTLTAAEFPSMDYLDQGRRRCQHGRKNGWAWGIFNWLTFVLPLGVEPLWEYTPDLLFRLMSLFYHQPGMLCPTSSPPLIEVPKGCLLDTSERSLVPRAEVVSWLPAYKG